MTIHNSSTRRVSKSGRPNGPTAILLCCGARRAQAREQSAHGTLFSAMPISRSCSIASISRANSRSVIASRPCREACALMIGRLVLASPMNQLQSWRVPPDCPRGHSLICPLVGRVTARLALARVASLLPSPTTVNRLPPLRPNSKLPSIEGDSSWNSEARWLW